MEKRDFNLAANGTDEERHLYCWIMIGRAWNTIDDIVSLDINSIDKTSNSGAHGLGIFVKWDGAVNKVMYS